MTGRDFGHRSCLNTGNSFRFKKKKEEKKPNGRQVQGKAKTNAASLTNGSDADGAGQEQRAWPGRAPAPRSRCGLRRDVGPPACTRSTHPHPPLPWHPLKRAESGRRAHSPPCHNPGQGSDTGLRRAPQPPKPSSLLPGAAFSEATEQVMGKGPVERQLPHPR